MKIGILKETKSPVDNRVALTPLQIRNLRSIYPNLDFFVQPSPTRAFSDREYADLGIPVAENMEECDVLLGIKEANPDTLIPGKHYFFFGHVAKMQLYNKPLLREMVNKHLTFSDWEYLVDNQGGRLVAFGWYAGVVGVYYTLRGWGMRTGTALLPEPHIDFSKEEIINHLRNARLAPAKILLTGNGRVSQGAQYVLDRIGARKVSVKEYLEISSPTGLVYTVAGPAELVKPSDPAAEFDHQEFVAAPEKYVSDFEKFADTTDILITGHFWSPDQPVYLTKELCTRPEFRIRMIGDITCDIEGSIKSTIRSSTHASPFYDYNPLTGAEEAPFTSADNISVMAVDTCPNALPRETSEFFGDKFIATVLPDLITRGMESEIVNRSSIVVDGKINSPFSYLENYLKSN